MARFTVHDNAIVFDDGGMNLLSSDALRELAEVIASVKTPLLIFKSGRDHIFAAGADMAEMSRFTPFQAFDFASLGQSVFDAIEKLPCVTIAMVDGDCFGGALDLILSFDLRFATPRSRFSHPGAKLGIVTGFGGTSRWRKVLSPPAARRLFLGNPVLSAEEAREVGLVDRVDESFDDELARLATLDPGTTRFVKELTIHGRHLGDADLRLLAERLAALYH
jgi:enoyl-CoA hydratase